MKKRKIYIGTSGWSYSSWKDNFYPKKISSQDLLLFYSENFNSVEVNNTFYKMPDKSVVKNWKKSVNDDFKFCLKLSKYITHVKKLNECENSFRYFVGAINPISSNLGPILIQLPSNLSFNASYKKTFFSYIKRFKSLSFAIEGRHDSWTSKEAIKFLKDNNFIWVISHSNEFPYLKEVTSSQVYLRFHGPKKLYDSNYPKRQLKSFSEDIKKWKKNKKTIWAFFNNDGHCYAPYNALMLSDMIKT